ncbi:hypothetical protein L6452_21584 [Arctium lappa]|uniref:Uncharacterized protein n=1 Tax=Arctium lappa TaxID=4217 RepID=A0ACB9AYR4_ARCLA|nr:hypothetical protein L6452_21584 [Arctium lappa]
MVLFLLLIDTRFCIDGLLEGFDLVEFCSNLFEEQVREPQPATTSQLAFDLVSASYKPSLATELHLQPNERQKFFPIIQLEGISCQSLHMMGLNVAGTWPKTVLERGSNLGLERCWKVAQNGVGTGLEFGLEQCWNVARI